MDVEITLSCERQGQGWTCEVDLAEGTSRTHHVVTVSDDEVARYSPGSAVVDALVERSFRFLLAREAKESILRRFALSDIERYFPEFRNRVGAA